MNQRNGHIISPGYKAPNVKWQPGFDCATPGQLATVDDENTPTVFMFGGLTKTASMAAEIAGPMAAAGMTPEDIGQRAVEIAHHILGEDQHNQIFAYHLGKCKTVEEIDELAQADGNKDHPLRTAWAELGRRKVQEALNQDEGKA